MAAIWGRADIVFGALLAYAAIKLGVVVHHAWRHYGAPASALLSGRYPGALHRQLAYVLPLGLASALFLLRGQADQWVAAALFPPAAFAAFSIGAVIMPLVALVRGAVSNAIAPRLSALEAGRDVAGMLRLNQRANLACAFVLVPALALVAVLAPHIVTVVYTASYAAAAGVMRINCLALLGVAVEVSTLTVVLNQGRFLLGADALLLPLSVAAAWLGASAWGLPGAALGNLLTLAAGNAFSFWRVARVTGVPLRGLQRWGQLLRIAGAAFGAAGLCLVLDRADLVRPALSEALLISAAFGALYLLLLALSGALPEARALFAHSKNAVASPPAP
ncbi:MAG: oligosaccharide flippase family protein [Massilia sp.]|nr:oligosaccharide flippase family protein [Massilia sp.]